MEKTNSTNTEFIQELTRINAEYRRRGREMPPGYYSLQKPWNLFIYTQRMHAVMNALTKNGFFPLNNKKILEIGCGAGTWLIDFEKWGADQKRLCGIDLFEDKINKAKHRLPLADLRIGEASSLPWQDGIFDIILQFTVFTSILSGQFKAVIAKEMLRVLKPDGVILWYDFMYDNPWNPNVRGIKAGEIKQLFSGCEIKLKKITLAPPIAKWLAPKSELVCHALEKICFLNTHYLGVIRPKLPVRNKK